MSKIEETFRGLGRTEKAKFISQNIDYANADASFSIRVDSKIKNFIVKYPKEVELEELATLFSQITQELNEIINNSEKSADIVSGETNNYLTIERCKNEQ